MAQNSRDLLARYAGEPFQKIIHSRAIFEVLEQRLNRNTGTFEQPCTAYFPRNSLNRRTLTPIKHALNVTDTVIVDKLPLPASRRTAPVRVYQHDLQNDDGRVGLDESGQPGGDEGVRQGGNDKVIGHAYYSGRRAVFLFPLQ